MPPFRVRRESRHEGNRLVIELPAEHRRALLSDLEESGEAEFGLSGEEVEIDPSMFDEPLPDGCPHRLRRDRVGVPYR